MQIPENPSNSDIREAILQLQEDLERRFEERFNELNDRLDKQDYKFDAYQKGTDGRVRMATTIIIATASVVVLANLSPAINALVTALSASGNS